MTSILNLSRRTGLAVFGVMLLTLTACVTINVYFPAAQAERAAERIVDEILGEPGSEAAPPDAATQPEADSGAWLIRDTDSLLASFSGLLIRDAVAASPDFSVNTPEIRRLESSMKNRHKKLVKFYDKGAIGFDNQALVAMRDSKAVSLKERGSLNSLLKAENADRNKLYKAIANANGHPEWEKDVRAVFAKKWVQKVRKGWWYQDSRGSWKQK